MKWYKNYQSTLIISWFTSQSSKKDLEKSVADLIENLENITTQNDIFNWKIHKTVAIKICWKKQANW